VDLVVWDNNNICCIGHAHYTNITDEGSLGKVSRGGTDGWYTSTE